MLKSLSKYLSARSFVVGVLVVPLLLLLLLRLLRVVYGKPLPLDLCRVCAHARAFHCAHIHPYTQTNTHTHSHHEYIF